MPARRVGLGGVATVFVAAALGTLLRYAIGRWWDGWGSFPAATAFINISGSLALGAVVGLASRRGRGTGGALAATAFLGGYTTYSTFAVDTAGLLRSGDGVTAAAYAVLSVAGGLVAAWLGYAIARGRR